MSNLTLPAACILLLAMVYASQSEHTPQQQSAVVVSPQISPATRKVRLLPMTPTLSKLYRLLRTTPGLLTSEDDDALTPDDDSYFQKRQYDDYGHMRFGKRNPKDFDDYGHMRFGKK